LPASLRYRESNDQALLQSGDTIFDPFAGIARFRFALRNLAAFGIGCELNKQYWKDSVFHLRCQEQQWGQLDLDMDWDLGEDISDLPTETSRSWRHERISPTYLQEVWRLCPGR